jgi:hypothetical protein
MNDFASLQNRLDRVGACEFARKLAFDGLASTLRLAFVQRYGFLGDQVSWGHLDADNSFAVEKIPRTKKSENSVRLALRIAFEARVEDAVTLIHYVPFELRIVGDTGDASLPGISDWMRITLPQHRDHFVTQIFESVDRWVTKQERALFLDHDGLLI